MNFSHYNLKEKASFTGRAGNNALKISLGFTLAEILITLAIVGVVAAITIPNLIANINSRVNNNVATVFNAKLIKGLNITKSQGDLNNTYSSTYDFLENGLGKNLKFAKICDTESIRDCIPYDKIKYVTSSNSEEEIDVNEIKTPSKLRLSGGFEDIASFVLADGTVAIVSYDKSCTVDDGKADTSISGCLAGIYDTNGRRKPNKFGTKIEEEKTIFTGDLRSFNGASLGCMAKGDGYCVISVHPANSANTIDGNGALWSRTQCQKDGGYLPTIEEFILLANDLYKENSDGTKTMDENSGLYSIFYPILSKAWENRDEFRTSSPSMSGYTASITFGYKGTDKGKCMVKTPLTTVCFGD